MIGQITSTRFPEIVFCDYYVHVLYSQYTRSCYLSYFCFRFIKPLFGYRVNSQKKKKKKRDGCFRVTLGYIQIGAVRVRVMAQIKLYVIALAKVERQRFHGG